MLMILHMHLQMLIKRFLKCNDTAIQCLQFDEPALVQDMTDKDRELLLSFTAIF